MFNIFLSAIYTIVLGKPPAFSKLWHCKSETPSQPPLWSFIFAKNLETTASFVAQIHLIKWQILQNVNSSRAEFLNWGFNDLSTLQFLKRHSENYWGVIFQRTQRYFTSKPLKEYDIKKCVHRIKTLNFILSNGFVFHFLGGKTRGGFPTRQEIWRYCFFRSLAILVTNSLTAAL